MSGAGRICALGVVAALGVAGALWYGPMRGASDLELNEVSRSGQAANEGRLAPAATGPIREDGDVPQAPALEDLLQLHWGDSWAEKRLQYEELGVDLSTDAEPFRPWDEVRQESFALGRSYYERDVAFLRKSFLGKADNEEAVYMERLGNPSGVEREDFVRELEADLSATDYELLALSDRYVAELDRVFASLAVTDPERYPLVDLRTPDKAPGGIYRVYVELPDWYVVYRIGRDDFPGVAEIRDEGLRLRGERMRIGNAFIQRNK